MRAREARVVKEMKRADGKRRVSILERSDGNYTFAEDADGDDGYTYDNWPVLVTGAIYDSAELAENEARAQVPWLTQATKDDQ